MTGLDAILEDPIGRRHKSVDSLRTSLAVTKMSH